MANISSGWRRLLVLLIAISASGSATYIYYYGPAYPNEADLVTNYVMQIIDTMYNKPEHGIEAYRTALEGGASPEQFIESQEPRIQESLDSLRKQEIEYRDDTGPYMPQIRSMVHTGIMQAELRIEMLDKLREQHELAVNNLPQRKRETIIRYLLILLGPILGLFSLWAVGSWIRRGFQTEGE